MKKNNLGNSEFENQLRDKMDELASSVDCFDKISNRAFPEKKTENSDYEYTVNELENVSGRKKRPKLLAAAAIAAAAVICLAFIPKNGGFMNFYYTYVDKSDNMSFREIISELKYETENFTYEFQDFALDEYIKYNVLITPLQSCPFEEQDKDNINVRIYTKTYNDIPTNQVYVIEYEGDYDDENFIAAADTKAKFTSEDFDKYSSTGIQSMYTTQSENFTLSENTLTDSLGAPVTAAEFAYQCIFKYNDDSFMLFSQIIYYYTNEYSENTEYYYDITGSCEYDYDYSESLSDSEALVDFDKTVLNDTWNNVVYYSDSSAEADTELSCFHEADIYCGEGESDFDSSSVLKVAPYSLADEDIFNADMMGTAISLYDENGSCLCSMIPPINSNLRICWVIYTADTGSDITALSDDDAFGYTLSYDYLSSYHLNIYYSGDSQSETLAQVQEDSDTLSQEDDIKYEISIEYETSNE